MSLKVAHRLSFALLLGGVAALLFLFCVIQLRFTATGHDQIWYLYAAEQQLAGTMLYGPHLTDTNPPLIIWFSTIPVVVSRMLHVRSDAGLDIVVCVMIVGSILWSIRIFRKSREWSVCGLCLLSSALLVTEFTQFAGPYYRFAGFPFGEFTFGQREHLLIILIIPYVIARASGAAEHLGWAERCALGITAGIGVCFKPQQALILVALELFFVVYARRLRHLIITPEALAVLATGVCYVALVLSLTPLYVTQVMPLLRDTYGALGGISVMTIVLTNKRDMFYLFATALASILLLRRLRDRVIVYALLACLAGAVAAFLLQHKGWVYQFRPASALLCFLALYLLCDLLDQAMQKPDAEWERHPAIVRTAFGSILFLLLLQAIQLRKMLADGAPPSIYNQLEPIGRMVADLRPDTPVSVLSTAVPVFTVMYKRHLTWASRFPCLWMLPAIVRNEGHSNPPYLQFKRLSPQTVASLSDLQRTDTAEDLDYWRPALVLVEQCELKRPCTFLDGYDFDMLAWFLKSPRFRSAWSHYQQQSGITGFAVYRRAN
jgi:hypothetical protein